MPNTGSSIITTRPHISIITVVFNGESFLEKTILSVIRLKSSEVEFIIIDGGSEDRTVEIIRKYHDKIAYWVSEPDKGIYDAFNKGWNAARADSYILYLGAGDEIISLPNNITNDDQAIYGKVMMNNNSYFRSKVDFRLRLGNTIHHQALLIKKNLELQSPFDTKFRTYADFDFTQRLLKRNIQFKFDETFIAYAMPGGVSQRFQFMESILVVKKNFGIAMAILSCIYYLLQSFRNKLIHKT